MSEPAPLVVGLGYCGLDRVCVVPEIPLDGKVEIAEEIAQGGGPAATATVAAARLGARAVFCGVVGGDADGQVILDGLRAEGVDTGAVRVRAGAMSAHAYCWAEAGTGRRSIAWTRGSSAALAADEVDGDLIASAQALLLDGHQPAAAIHAAELARAAGVPVLLDAGSQLPSMEALLSLCDHVVASREFVARRWGVDEPEAAAKALAAACGATRTLVTLGGDGCVWVDQGQCHRLPAFAVEVVDTTGAGDVFHGAFAFGLAHRWPWDRLVPFAAAVAALKCRRLGGRAGIPSLAETSQFLCDAGCRPAASAPAD